VRDSLAVVRPLLPGRGTSARAILILTAAVMAAQAAVLLLTAGIGSLGDPVHLARGATVVVALYSAASGLACVAAFRAKRQSSGVAERVWRLMGLGLLLWTIGGLTYIAFLVSGGDPTSPAAWSQAGYLLAYPFWYRALWLLRQPALKTSRPAWFERLSIEAIVLVLVAISLAGVLWVPSLPAGENLAQLVPAILDVVLFAAFYNAVRRASLTRDDALLWIGYSFATLAVTDQLVTYCVTHGWFFASAFGLLGYTLAMGLMTVAARRQLRTAEAQMRLSASSNATLGALGLALSGFVAVLAPAALRPIIWALCIYLLWRVWASLSARENSDTDLLTGFLDDKAFERHLAGVVATASEENGGLLIAVDITGFGAWNAKHGFARGDTLLAATAHALESADLADGVWGRLSADRFAWVGGVRGRDGHELAQTLRDLAQREAGELWARAGVVVVPRDAETAAKAIAAVGEALTASRESGRDVVAFDGGALEGLDVTPGSASFAQRREKILEVLADPEAIVPNYQPIVDLDSLEILGHEALSRFPVEPRRGPDKWIDEATAVGMGIELEMECLRRAWQQIADAPEGTYLSVNASASAILSDEFEEFFADSPLDRLVIEITEHERIDNYPRIAARLALFRGRGARVAIDDTGAGHASLNHVMQLRPEYVKLDRALIQNLGVDPGRRALVRSMVTLTQDLGASLIAEGIETSTELNTLRRLGVRAGQGYFFAKPAPAFQFRVSPEVSPEESGVSTGA
jgi:EAL domain-containing protein (putative c-di-GMP-specific phosphodiesterase class I)/GGDEF domain-containing protein